MATRWAAWFAVSGDARFLSHHDTLRLMERAAMRAGLPLKHSQGFNPRPRLSLPAPRPAGVASRCELLEMTFDGDVTDTAWSGGLAGQLPRGVELLEALLLPPGRPLQMQSAAYEMPMRPDEADTVRRRLEYLDRAGRWIVRRSGRRGRTMATPEREVDVTGRLRDVRVEGEMLRFTLINTPAGGVRCAEALSLLGLCDDANEAVARLTRTALRGTDLPHGSDHKELDS